jgi:hypothetical protein
MHKDGQGIYFLKEIPGVARTPKTRKCNKSRKSSRILISGEGTAIL